MQGRAHSIAAWERICMILTRRQKEIFDLAGDQIKEWCFEGDAETLKQTHVTQPTIYTTSMAAYKALLAELDKNDLADKLEIVAMAGFSLKANTPR